MSLLLVGVVLAAAVAHATWNAIVKSVPDQRAGMAVINLVAALCGLVVVVFAPLPRGGAWPYLVASAIIHLGYSALLGRAYRLGDFSQTYPLARGLSPLLVALVAPIVAAESLNGMQLGALALLCGGLATLVIA